MAQITARFRVRTKDEWSPNQKQVVLTATRLAENGAMTENQSLWGEDESSQNQIQLFINKSAEAAVMPKGSDVLVTFTST